MVLVKICGVRRVEDAQMALDAGADMIGIILVPNRGRTVSLETAKAISELVHAKQAPAPAAPAAPAAEESHQLNYFACQSLSLENMPKPLLVGVVMNQPLEEVQELQRTIGLDVIQLHGNEPLEMCRELSGPVIKRFTPKSTEFSGWKQENYHTAILIDGETGGNGELVNWGLLGEISNTGAPFILGGGITPDNVKSAVKVPGVFMVDVSSGVEQNEGPEKGFKSEQKVRDFIKGARDVADAAA